MVLFFDKFFLLSLSLENFRFLLIIWCLQSLQSSCSVRDAERLFNYRQISGLLLHPFLWCCSSYSAGGTDTSSCWGLIIPEIVFFILFLLLLLLPMKILILLFHRLFIERCTSHIREIRDKESSFIYKVRFQGLPYRPVIVWLRHLCIVLIGERWGHALIKVRGKMIRQI